MTNLQSIRIAANVFVQRIPSAAGFNSYYAVPSGHYLQLSLCGHFGGSHPVTIMLPSGLTLSFTSATFNPGTLILPEGFQIGFNQNTGATCYVSGVLFTS